MTAAALPLVALCAALGLALGFLAPRWAVRCLLLLAGGAILVAMAGARVPLSADDVTTATWGATLAAAASLYAPQRLRIAIVSGLAVVGAGLLGASGASASSLAAALACTSIVVPARVAITRGHAVAVHVVASWLIAVAILALTLHLTAGPADSADHME